MKYFVLVFFSVLLSSGRLQELNNDNYNLISGNIWRSNSNELNNNVDSKPCAREGNPENDRIDNEFDSLDSPKGILPPLYDENPQPRRNQLLKLRNKDLYDKLDNPPLKITNLEDTDRPAARSRDSEPEHKFKFIPNNVLERGPENDYINEAKIDSAPKNDYISSPVNVIDRENEYKSVARAQKSPDKSSRVSVPEEVSSPTRRSQSGPQGIQQPQGKCLLDGLRRSNTDNDDELEDDTEPKNAAPYPENQAQDNLRSYASGNKPLNKDDMDRSYDKAPIMSNDKDTKRVGNRPNELNDARRLEPTYGATNMQKSPLTLMKSERVCYACSTANNPSCWAPDRRTTVKYCRKGNNACITKVFGTGSTYTLIRDCGRSCDDPEMGGLGPRYKSCSMCHSELCNGAFSINGQSIIFALLLTALVKYMN